MLIIENPENINEKIFFHDSLYPKISARPEALVLIPAKGDKELGGLARGKRPQGNPGTKSDAAWRSGDVSLQDT